MAICIFDDKECVAFATLLKSCMEKKDLSKGAKIYARILKRGLLNKSSYVGNSLVSMYAKCGAITKAQQVFDTLPIRDVVSWSALISGYAHHGQGEDALNYFHRMQSEGFSPDAITYTSVLKACSALEDIDQGNSIHSEIISKGFLGTHDALGNALVDMYAKFGLLVEAKHVFEKLPARNVVTWNALITGCTQLRQDEDVVNCFRCMQTEGVIPNAVTFTCILKTCANAGKLEMGQRIHQKIVTMGLLENDIRLGNALIDMYAKCGRLVKAQEVLNKLAIRNTASWNTLVSGYVQQGQGEEALNHFEQMQREGHIPDEITFTCILKACGCMGAFDKGKEIHEVIDNKGLLGNDVVLGTALVDMYARCGAVMKAQEVLTNLPFRSTISWNALISGYAQQGQGKEALSCFRKMLCEGVTPNIITFLCLLNACSHSGLVDEGEMWFSNVGGKCCDLLLDFQHYTCMVDVFGRAGCLDKALSMIKRMPCYDYPPLWNAVLGASRKWACVNTGTVAFERAVQLDENDAAYTLMANIYAAFDRQEDAKKMQFMRIQNAMEKT